MKKCSPFFIILCFFISTQAVKAQTAKNIQGTWRIIATTITFPDGGIFKMDSASHNLTKIITQNRVTFTIYDKKTDSLMITGQGMASTNGNQYIERFEQSTSKNLLKEPVVFTYKVEGNKLTYEGGNKSMHIVEVLQKIE